MPPDPSTPAPARPAPLAALTLLIAGLTGSLVTLESGFDAVLSGDTVRYVVSVPSAARVALALALAAACIWLAYTAALRVARRGDSDVRTPPEAVAVACLRPLGLIAINTLALPLLWLPAGRWSAPWLYVTVDLHPWVTAGALVLTLGSLWRAGGVAADAPRWRAHAADAALALGLALAVTWSSPLIRFSSIVTGDEPKYLRYCESWWQGRGVDIEAVQDASAAAGAPSRFGAVLAQMGPEVQRDLRALRRDLRTLSNPSHWGDRFNRSVDAGSAFLRGKRGGLFQVHNPGLSLILLPAYIVDRTWFDRGQGRFADPLYAVNLTCLALFALLAVVLRRLATTQGVNRVAAAGVASVLALSIPIGAFAFQFYPETAGAVITALACVHLVSGRAWSPTRAVGLGLALGFLGWLHVRFMAIGAVALAWLCLAHAQRREWRALLLTCGAFVVPTLLLSFYAYHITGSLMPNAVYGPAGVETQFAWALVPRGLVAVFFDRDYGLLPLNPALWLALPGLGVLWARRERRTLGVVTTTALALIVPTAGHGLTFANTTPLRFVLAVIPVAAVPMAACLRELRGRAAWTVVAVLLSVIAVRNGIEHSLQNDKVALTLRHDSVSGWNPSLVFPTIDNGQPFTQLGPNLWLLGVWMAVGVGSVVAGRRLVEPAASVRVAPQSTNAPALIVASLAGVVLVAWCATALGAPARAPQFLFQRHRPPTTSALHDRTRSARATGSVIVGN